jgi:hypothetical protein
MEAQVNRLVEKAWGKYSTAPKRTLLEFLEFTELSSTAFGLISLRAFI